MDTSIASSVSTDLDDLNEGSFNPAQSILLGQPDELAASIASTYVPDATHTRDIPESVDTMSHSVILAPLSLPSASSSAAASSSISPSSSAIQLYEQYDNIYGKITISTVAKRITEHPWFRRLQDIKQLGPLHFKFPHATHSRFSHSIGVAYLARMAGQVLRGKNTGITDREILCLEIAALCHDIGHGAYSHSFDHLLRDIGFKSVTSHHEVRSQIITKRLIESIPELNISPDEIRLIQYFIDTDKYKLVNTEAPPRYTAGLEQIVSNPIHKLDVDKMDYLLRDAQALRFDLTIDGTLDVRGLIKRSQLVYEEKDQTVYWMFHIRDQGIVYDLICRRFIFYNNYYVHPHVNSINCMLTDALRIVNRVTGYAECVKLETPEHIAQYVQLTDAYFLELILNSTDGRLSEAKDLIERIVMGKNWYEHMGDFVTNIDNLDETSYVELPWEIFTDKSTPTTLLPKVRYHQNGLPIKPADVKNTRRLYRKPDV